MLVDSETPERRFGLQIREQEDPAHLGSSYTSDASSTFSSQGYDSPPTSFSSRATSPSLSHVSGKTRSSSEQACTDDEYGTAVAPPLKKSKLESQCAGEKAAAIARPCAEQNKKECTVVQISRALLVDNLVDVTVKTIGSVWGRFSRESQCQLPALEEKQRHANSTLPLDLFVREILRRSRTSCSTLQAALLYCVRCKDAVYASVEKAAQCTEHVVDTCAGQASSAGSTPTLSGSSSHSSCGSSSFRLPSLSLPLAHLMSFRNQGPDGKECVGHVRSISPLLCGRRMFLAAIVVASKFLQDRTYSNRTWSKISGLPTKEVEQIERVFLHAIQYDLVVKEMMWSSWTQELASRWNRTKDTPSDPTTKAFKCSPKMQGARLQRAFSENVLGQELPFDSLLTNAPLPRTGFARHETMS